MTSSLVMGGLLFAAFLIPGTASRCEWADPVEGVLNSASTMFYRMNASVADCKAICEADNTCQAVVAYMNDGSVVYCAGMSCAFTGRCELVGLHGRVFDCLERPTSLIVGGGLLSVATGGVAFLTIHRLVEPSFLRSVFGALFAASIVACLGALPLLVSPNPARCFHLDVTDILRNSAIFPFSLTVSAASTVGFVIACIKLKLANWSLGDPLAKCATIYCCCSFACNSLGVVGGIFTTCFRATRVRSPVLGAWIATSIATNIILHKTLLLRAKMCANSQSERWSRIAYCSEVWSVLTSVLLVCVSAGARELGLSQHAYWVPVYFMAICCALTLFCSDFALSFIAFRASYNALQDVRSHLISQGGNSSLRRALSIAKVSLYTVAVSVVTTSVFYVIAIVALAFEANNTPSVLLNRALVIAWCLDSLSNDTCAIIVGFVPISGALEMIASAKHVDVIGTPLPNPSSRMESPVVIGHALSAATFDDGSMSSIDTKEREKHTSL